MSPLIYGKACAISPAKFNSHDNVTYSINISFRNGRDWLVLTSIHCVLITKLKIQNRAWVKNYSINFASLNITVNICMWYNVFIVIMNEYQNNTNRHPRRFCRAECQRVSHEKTKKINQSIEINEKLSLSIATSSSQDASSMKLGPVSFRGRQVYKHLLQLDLRILWSHGFNIWKATNKVVSSRINADNQLYSRLMEMTQ